MRYNIQLSMSVCFNEMTCISLWGDLYTAYMFKSLILPSLVLYDMFSMRSTARPSICLPFHLHLRTTHLVAHFLGGHKMLVKRLDASCLMVLLKQNSTPAPWGQNGRKSSQGHNEYLQFCRRPPPHHHPNSSRCP